MDSSTAQPGSTSALNALQRVLFAIQAAVGFALAGALLVVLAGILPTFFGMESFTVYSGSMEPSIPVGSLAVVRPVPTSQLRTGDVITYRMPFFPDVVVTHRLMGITDAEGGKKNFRTKGDANEVEDLVLVEPNAVLGKVIYSVPYAGYLVEYSKGSTGRLLLIGLPALLLLVDFLRHRTGQAVERRTAPAAPTSSAPAPVPPAYHPATSAVLGSYAPPGQGTHVTPMAPVPQLAEPDRIEALLSRGREALAAGRPDLATRAADGVLAVDPRSERGWLLKAQSAPDRETRLMLLRTALALNPAAPELQSALWLAESPTGDMSSPPTFAPGVSQNTSPGAHRENGLAGAPPVDTRNDAPHA